VELGNGNLELGFRLRGTFFMDFPFGFNINVQLILEAGELSFFCLFLFDIQK
jgi:hypothetical protein